MLTLEQRVASAVAGVLEQHAVELERLVAAIVDRELDRMLGELELELEQRANGDRPARVRTPAAVPSVELERPVPRLCSDCGREPVLEGRRIGRRCKTARDRASRGGRARAGDDED